jgi:hypothetical protein
MFRIGRSLILQQVEILLATEMKRNYLHGSSTPSDCRKMLQSCKRWTLASHAHRIDSRLPRYRDCSTAQSVVRDRVEESGRQIGAADAGSALDWSINRESISPFRGAIGEVRRT